jgi:hypothetical protein
MEGLYPKGTRVIATDKSVGKSKLSSYHYGEHKKGENLYYIKPSVHTEGQHVLSTNQHANDGDYFLERDFYAYNQDLMGEEI